MLFTVRPLWIARLVAVGSAIAASSTNDTGGSCGQAGKAEAGEQPEPHSPLRPEDRHARPVTVAIGVVVSARVVVHRPGYA